jgi:hypothetical protein
MSRYSLGSAIDAATLLELPQWDPCAEKPLNPAFIRLVPPDLKKLACSVRGIFKGEMFICSPLDIPRTLARLADGEYDAVKFTAVDFVQHQDCLVVNIIAIVIKAMSKTVKYVDVSFLHDSVDIDDPTELVVALVDAPKVKSFNMTWTICEHQLELNEVLNRLAQKRGIQLGLEYEQSGGCTCPGKCVVSERFKDI